MYTIELRFKVWLWWWDQLDRSYVFEKEPFPRCRHFKIGISCLLIYRCALIHARDAWIFLIDGCQCLETSYFCSACILYCVARQKQLHSPVEQPLLVHIWAELHLSCSSKLIHGLSVHLSSNRKLINGLSVHLSSDKMFTHGLSCIYAAVRSWAELYLRSSKKLGWAVSTQQ